MSDMDSTKNASVAPEGPAGQPLPSYLLKWLGFTVLLLALYFVPAWRVDLPMAWVALGTYLIWILVFGLVYSQQDPGMLAERRKAGPGVKSWDQIWIRVYGVFFLVVFVVAGLDVGWIGGPGAVPLGLQIAGWAIFVAGLAVGWWATSVNTFFSRMVRIQEDRGHRVVSTGPYRFVRHPGYLMAVVVWPGLALALGSWWALVPAGIIVLLYIYRTAREDRTLREELAGYAEYAQKTRYRLVPGVW